MKKTISKLGLALLLIACIASCQKDNSDIPVATSIELLSGKFMQGVAGQQLTDSIVVIIKDQFDHPLKDVILNCQITEGSLPNENPVTNIDGKASFVWKLGPAETQSLYIKVLETNGTNIAGSPIKVDATAALPIVTDVDNNEYNTVRIGNQVWMTENLRTTKYSDGTPIPLVENEEDWASLSNIDKAYCLYNNTENVDVRYGILYTWAAATNDEGYSETNPSGIIGVCPDGWHIPSSSEWIQLYEFLGGSEIAGGKMKEAGLDNWLYPNADATNSSRFTALPAGYRGANGSFNGMGTYAHYWSTTENCMPCGPSNWWLSTDASNFYHGGSSYFNSGYSVRCVMDYN